MCACVCLFEKRTKYKTKLQWHSSTTTTFVGKKNKKIVPAVWRQISFQFSYYDVSNNPLLSGHHRVPRHHRWHTWLTFSAHLAGLCLFSRKQTHTDRPAFHIMTFFFLSQISFSFCYPFSKTIVHLFVLVTKLFLHITTTSPFPGFIRIELMWRHLIPTVCLLYDPYALFDVPYFLYP